MKQWQARHPTQLIPATTSFSTLMKLAGELGVKDEPGMSTLMGLLDELKTIIQGVKDGKIKDEPKLRAQVSSFGELMSTALGVLAINKAGVPCVRLDARKLIKYVRRGTG